MIRGASRLGSATPERVEGVSFQGCDASDAQVGMAVQVAFESMNDSDIVLPVFKPVQAVQEDNMIHRYSLKDIFRR